MTIQNKTTNIYTEWKPLVEALSDDEAGKVFKCIFKYQSNEPVECTNPVWVFIKSKIDEYNHKGAQISEIRREIGRSGGLAKASKCQQVLANDGKPSNKIKENKTKQNKIKENNIKPSLQDVIDYCNERNNGIDANKWYDYYTANGWKVGRVPMKDWRATVRTWERKQEKPAQQTNEWNEKMVLIDTTSFYLDDTMDEYKDLFEGVLNKDELALNVWKWIVKNFEGRDLKLSFIRSMIEKFKNEGGKNERSIEK